MECNANTIRTEPGVEALKCKYTVAPNPGQSDNHLRWQEHDTAMPK